MAHDCPHDGTPAFGCRSCYAHLKFKVRGGELTEDERAFVGATVHVHDTSGGWRSLQDSAWELDSVLSADDVELLQSLMSVGTSQERLEFLG